MRRFIWKRLPVPRKDFVSIEPSEKAWISAVQPYPPNIGWQFSKLNFALLIFWFEWHICSTSTVVFEFVSAKCVIVLIYLSLQLSYYLIGSCSVLIGRLCAWTIFFKMNNSHFKVQLNVLEIIKVPTEETVYRLRIFGPWCWRCCCLIEA